jgi:hypothetical protein
MKRTKARTVALLASAFLVTVGLTACGGTHQIRPLSLKNAPPAFKDLTHPRIFTPSEVKAAFAKHGIRLREMRTRYGPHVVVLFDPRWHAPTDFGMMGGPPGPPTYIWVFIRANDNASSFDQVGNVYAAYGPGEEQSENAALNTLNRVKH